MWPFTYFNRVSMAHWKKILPIPVLGKCSNVQIFSCVYISILHKLTKLMLTPASSLWSAQSPNPEACSVKQHIHGPSAWCKFSGFCEIIWKCFLNWNMLAQARAKPVYGWLLHRVSLPEPEPNHATILGWVRSGLALDQAFVFFVFNNSK